MDQAKIRDGLDTEPREARGGVKNAKLCAIARRQLVFLAPRAFKQVLVGKVVLYLTKSEDGFDVTALGEVAEIVFVLHSENCEAASKEKLDIVDVEELANRLVIIARIRMTNTKMTVDLRP